MKEESIGCLLVADATGLKGVVTDRDLLVGCLGEAHDPWECLVTRHMSGDVVTADPAMEVHDAAHMMVSRKIKRLPVVEGGQLVGLVSFSDIGHSMG
jgi:CBS domain-containing protein